MEKTPGFESGGPLLRLASMADAPLLMSILHAAFEEYRGWLDPPSGVYDETVDTVLLKLQEGRAVIAEVAGEPAGCVFYQPEEGYLYLGRLSVLPQYRKHGLARALMEFVEQQAKLLLFPRVQLGVRIALPQLREYYERRGYRVIRYERHKGYAEPTYMVMEKEVG